MGAAAAAVAGPLIGGAIQAGGSIAAARLQYKAEKEKIALQKEIWEQQKEWAKAYHDLWFDHYRPVELSFLEYMAGKEPYEPQYDAVESRAIVALRREFGMAQTKARQCIDPRCIGHFCHTTKELSIAEAKAAVSAINKAWRAEEARKDIKDAQWEESLFAVLKLGRGLTDGALNALEGASRAGQAAAGADPYGGYAKAIGNIAGTLGNAVSSGFAGQYGAPKAQPKYDFSNVQYVNSQGQPLGSGGFSGGINTSNLSYAGPSTKPLFSS